MLRSCWIISSVNFKYLFLFPPVDYGSVHGSCSEKQSYWLELVSEVSLVGSAGKEAEDLRDKDSIPGMGRSPRGGHGNPLQYSCLENPIDRGAWRTTTHGAAKSWTQLKQLGVCIPLKYWIIMLYPKANTVMWINCTPVKKEWWIPTNKSNNQEWRLAK